MTTHPVITTDNNTALKLSKIKKRFNETVEMNKVLTKEFGRAKKKIKVLTFERNLLLDKLAQMNNNRQLPNISDTSSNSSNNSQAELSDHDYESPPPAILQSRPRVTTTVASAPPKRSKINRVSIKTRRVQPIERDSDGIPKLPQQIGVLTVLSLGTINLRESFHNERYIFPVGYTVRRTYPSMIDPHNNTMITSTILDSDNGPRFHVLAADQPNDPIIANSATGAWTVVVRKSNEIRHRDHSNSASGPDYYGFKHPTIAKMIQDLPGTAQLKNYVWQNFEEMEPRAAKGVMAAAEKKRDNLEHMGNANGANHYAVKKNTVKYSSPRDNEELDELDQED